MKDDFLDDVMELNTELMQAMTRKMAGIVEQINAVKTGIDKQHQHEEGGKIAKDEDGNQIILHPGTRGYVGEVMDV